MARFTEEEARYLTAQRLGRLATVNAAGQPHVTPVSFRYDPKTETIGIGGHGFAAGKKIRDVRANARVAFVVDDLVSEQPWHARGVEIRGTAEVRDTGGTELGPGFDETWLRITPRRIIAWSFGPDAFSSSRRTVD